MAEHFAHLVISPNPYNGNYLHAVGGVPVKGPEPDKEVLEYNNAMIHYIKIGHQSDLKNRFAAYNTENPSIWFRHFQFTNTLDSDTKYATLKNAGKPTDVGTSANYIQKLTLENKLRQAFRAKEWFIVVNNIQALKKLCGALDKNPVDKEIHKANKTIKGKVNVFIDEDDCITVLKQNSGDIIIDIPES